MAALIDSGLRFVLLSTKIYTLTIHFYKYQATGNDFVLLDNRLNQYALSTSEIEKICHRHFGIGADGLILLENDNSADFNMVYYNSDGGKSTMCGNGGRCMARFAQDLGIVNEETEFMAIDGLHQAEILEEVSLKMMDVNEVKIIDSSTAFLKTGSPHHVNFVENLRIFPVFDIGRKIRHEVYGKEGANVNFVEIINDFEIHVRTYERGVENETLSCGTGVTAAVLAFRALERTNKNTIKVNTPGGVLKVKFTTRENNTFENIWLCGPATKVFEGHYILRP